MHKLLIILELIIIFTTCQVGAKTQLSKFDKKQWLVSSSYRYDASRTYAFPDLKGKSKKEVMRLLGEPCVVQGERFIYCFDINVKPHYDNELKRNVCNCKGASLIVDFEVDERWRTTFIRVERVVEK